LVEITSAPVAISGFDGGSNLMNQSVLARSRTVKPGVMPSLLPETTVHGPSAGGPDEFGPRTYSSTVSARRPRRFVNQLESGTSSIVFTFTARWLVWSPGFRNVFSTKSYGSLISRSCTSRAFRVSGSTSSGSSG
jgi:hypothetical protein